MFFQHLDKEHHTEYKMDPNGRLTKTYTDEFWSQKRAWKEARYSRSPPGGHNAQDPSSPRRRTCRGTSSPLPCRMNVSWSNASVALQYQYINIYIYTLIDIYLLLYFFFFFFIVNLTMPWSAPPNQHVRLPQWRPASRCPRNKQRCQRTGKPQESKALMMSITTLRACAILMMCILNRYLTRLERSCASSTAQVSKKKRSSKTSTKDSSSKS